MQLGCSWSRAADEYKSAERNGRTTELNEIELNCPKETTCIQRPSLFAASAELLKFEVGGRKWHLVSATKAQAQAQANSLGQQNLNWPRVTRSQDKMNGLESAEKCKLAPTRDFRSPPESPVPKLPETIELPR